LVTKKYLKDYDNQWAAKWKAMEEETSDRFDRLETRLSTFEENVLRVELKIENDVKQCLVVRTKMPSISGVAVLRRVWRVASDATPCLMAALQELDKCLRRLDEVEESGRESMRIGFDRVERDITDVTLVINFPSPPPFPLSLCAYP
jgi:hypothetical protein